MRDYQDIFDIAADRKGGANALEALLRPDLNGPDPTAAPDDRWLSMMTRCIFQAGFNWKVVEAKWPGFEEAFGGFDLGRCAFMDDERLDALTRDTRVIRNAGKLRSVRENAVFLTEFSQGHASVAAAFCAWPAETYADLLLMLKKEATRMGGASAQYFLRFMGIDSYILSRDVVARLIAEGVVDKQPTSARDLRAVQAAFNTWAEQSDRSLTQISRTLAMSIG